MAIQHSIRLLGLAIALASGLTLASAASASPCIYSSLKGTESGSLLSPLHNLSDKIDSDSLWRLGILASSLAAIGGGIAFDLRRQRQAAIAPAQSDLDFEVAYFAIAVPPEAIAPSAEIRTESETAIVR